MTDADRMTELLDKFHDEVVAKCARMGQLKSCAEDLRAAAAAEERELKHAKIAG